MKFRDRTKEENNFEPVRLEIVLETKDDLREFWHRFNVIINSEGFKKLTSSCIDIPENENTLALWERLDEIAKEKGLKKDWIRN